MAEPKPASFGSLTLRLAPLSAPPGALLARSGLRESRAGLPTLPNRHAAPVQIDIPAGALPPGTRVVVRLPEAVAPPDGASAPAGLPPLFRNQRVVGPAVTVTSAAPLAAPVELTLPFDPVALSAAGATIDDVVVMAIDDGHRLYRELRPIAVDSVARSVRVVTRAFSTFFPCTAGIGISAPRLRRDAAGQASAWASGAQATIAGQVEGTRGRVAFSTPSTAMRCRACRHGRGRAGSASKA